MQQVPAPARPSFAHIVPSGFGPFSDPVGQQVPGLIVVKLHCSPTSEQQTVAAPGSSPLASTQSRSPQHWSVESHVARPDRHVAHVFAVLRSAPVVEPPVLQSRPAQHCPSAVHAPFNPVQVGDDSHAPTVSPCFSCALTFPVAALLGRGGRGAEAQEAGKGGAGEQPQRNAAARPCGTTRQSRGGCVAA